MSHTPGPWTANGRFVFDESHGAPIAMAQCASVSMEDAEANARLMAAAPDLLAVCMALLAKAVPFDSVTADDGIIADMRAAVAKAKGETP